ncbi:hypothetical protein [Blastococcus capsensis]|nr:hypothetical protein [Blastococcus capsensis]MDK3255595.1 hypothetical protein [Blastococcus capsensis]
MTDHPAYYDRPRPTREEVIAAAGAALAAALERQAAGQAGSLTPG